MAGAAVYKLPLISKVTPRTLELFPHYKPLRAAAGWLPVTFGGVTAVPNSLVSASSRVASIATRLQARPDVTAGDSVWWHCDLIHSVAPVVDQRGWGNVMYIPAAPWCPRNEAHAPSVLEAFITGTSPTDFPAEHYERDWTGRYRYDELTEVGRRSLGIEDS